MLLMATSIYNGEMIIVLEGSSDQISFTYFMMKLTKDYLPLYCARPSIPMEDILIIYDNACKAYIMLISFV